MGLVQSCLGKKNKVGAMPEEEVEVNEKIEREVREVEEENSTMEPLHGVEQSTDASAKSSAATEDVVKKVFHSSVPKLPPIFKTNCNLEEEKEPMVEKQESAQVGRLAAQEQEITAAQRPKAAKFKRTVHVAFSDNIS